MLCCVKQSSTWVFPLQSLAHPFFVVHFADLRLLKVVLPAPFPGDLTHLLLHPGVLGVLVFTVVL